MKHSYFGMPILALIVGASQAQSATLSMKRNDFLAMFSSEDIVTETYDGAGEAGKPASTAGVTYSTSTGKKVIVTDYFISSTGLNGLGSEPTFSGAASKGYVSGPKSEPFEYFNYNQTVTLTFAKAITAIGIDINSYALLDGRFTASTDSTSSKDDVLSRYDSFGTYLNEAGGHVKTNYGSFIGFSSDTPFTSITFASTNATKADRLNYNLDTLRYVLAPSTIPLPLGLPLLLSGLAALGVLRRRR